MGLLDSRPLLLGVHIAQIVLAIIILGLSAYVVTYAPFSSACFVLFCAIWTLLIRVVLFFLPRAGNSQVNHPYVPLAVEAITMIFWFAGFIALAVLVGGYYCGGSVCDAGKGAAALGAFEWLLFAFTTTLSAMAVFGRNSNSRKTAAPPTVENV